MQLFFDHIAGKTHNFEVIYSPASAIFEADEFDFALQNGWLITPTWYSEDCDWFNTCKAEGIPVWYQSRTVRLDPKKYVQKKRHRQRLNKDHNLSYKVHTEYDVEAMVGIYKRYLGAKGFIDMYGENHPFSKSDYGTERMIIVFSYADEPVAFSLLDIVGKSAVATQFCWDYKDPNLSIGKLSYYVEQQVAKNAGLDYIYLGASYEKSAISKCNYAGFQWWNGRGWSSNKASYQKLCARESEITTLQELAAMQSEYFRQKMDTK